MKILCFIALFGAFNLSRLDSSDFYERLNNAENAVLLDVRDIDEFCNSRIPGAIWSGRRVVLDSLLKDLDKKAIFFIYCDLGGRSEEVARILKKSKIKNVIMLKEGFIKWQRDNFPIDDSPLSPEECNRLY